MAKLTERQKKNIVSAYAAGGVSYSDLAAKYKVDKATISRIKKEEKNDFATKCNAIKKKPRRSNEHTNVRYVNTVEELFFVSVKTPKKSAF